MPVDTLSTTATTSGTVSSGKSSKRPTVPYPSLYQINTRVLLNELTPKRGSHSTLDDIPDSMLDQLVGRGFDWIWLLGVWQTGLAGQKVSRSVPEWQEEFIQVLPDLRQEDITGSCFAVVKYEVSSTIGGPEALARFRTRLQHRGLKLMLDFVPNHTALDHAWVRNSPGFYIHGTEQQLQEQPQNYIRLKAKSNPTIFAHGRDPYFPGWPDTLQLNYAEAAVQDAMIRELRNIAYQCDGVRCDMAMLILPEVFERTWGVRSQPFWPRAIETIRSHHKEFVFMAEVYWDLEWTLQQQGFDFTYDKRLYDRLREGDVSAIRSHLWADLAFQRRSARFLENHDEPRAASIFSPEVEKAAAVVSYFCPGLRFFHDGQLEGRKTKVPVHLSRRCPEAVNAGLLEFYECLLAAINRPAVRDGGWRLLDCNMAWGDNFSSNNFIAYAWQRTPTERLVVVTNYSQHQSQCYVQLPFSDISGRKVKFVDLLGSVVYERNGEELLSRGLYLDLPPWGYHVFAINSQS